MLAGFDDYKKIRSDPSLKALQGEEQFSKLLNKVILPAAGRCCGAATPPRCSLSVAVVEECTDLSDCVCARKP